MPYLCFVMFEIHFVSKIQHMACAGCSRATGATRALYFTATAEVSAARRTKPGDRRAANWFLAHARWEAVGDALMGQSHITAEFRVLTLFGKDFRI